MNKSSALGIDENIGGTLAYIFPMPIILFLMKEENEFIKYHSFQSLFLAIVAIAGQAVSWVVFSPIPLLGAIFSWLFSLTMVAVWIVCMIKAYQNERWKLPVIGEIALKQALKK